MGRHYRQKGVGLGHMNGMNRRRGCYGNEKRESWSNDLKPDGTWPDSIVTIACLLYDEGLNFFDCMDFTHETSLPSADLLLVDRVVL